MRTAISLAAAAALGGCGSSLPSGLIAHASNGGDPPSIAKASQCAATVVDTLGDIAKHVYHEGVASSRTASARFLITHSITLREAVEQNDPRAALAAARALIATGHMTNVTVLRGASRLLSAGRPGALAPIEGTLTSAQGAPIATYIASVWADDSYISETNGISEGATALRAGAHSVGDSFPLPARELSAEGSLNERGASYRYTSFPVAAYPTGQERVYLLRSIASTDRLCAGSQEDTVFNTVSHVATLIYTGETGPLTLPQVRRVQHNQALLHAVAEREPAATKLAIDNLLNEHIVRLRVSARGHLLSDVGGPFVLAPVRAPLRLNGRTVGSFVLSIQDDLGYRLLAQRLAGVDVVMQMGSRMVMSSLDPAPTQVPAQGPFVYLGNSYRVFTINAQAFPSGPLTIRVLIPIPYGVPPASEASRAPGGRDQAAVSDLHSIRPERATCASRSGPRAVFRRSRRISPRPRARACR